MIDCGAKIFPTAGLLQKILMEKKNSYVFFVNLGRVSDKEERGGREFFFLLAKAVRTHLQRHCTMNERVDQVDHEI